MRVGTFSKDEMEKHPAYLAAKHQDESFRPEPDKEYEWVYHYALQKIQTAREVVASIDSKAEIMARYVGAGSGVLGLAFSAFVFLSNKTLGITIVPSFAIVTWGCATTLILLLSMWSAVRVILPNFAAIGPSIQSALEVTSHFHTSNECLGYMSASLHTTLVSISLLLNHKVRWLHIAYTLFTLGVLSVLIGAILFMGAFGVILGH
jgi:hypothetical protein